MRAVIVGNSGSGKSTLAAALAQASGAAVLDLDTIAWQSGVAPPTLRPAAEAATDVRRFCAQHAHWVVEGCYGALAGAALDVRPLLVFMNPGVEACLAHCRARPWEPHKYASKAEQDARLAFLLQWVADYETRADDLSLRAHRALFDGYAGPKRELTSPAALPAAVVALLAAT